MKTLFKFLAFVTKIQYLIQPSFIQGEGHLRKLLLRSARIYYLYSGLLFALLTVMNYFNITINFWFSLVLFMIQAAILFHVLQTYRRFFSISPKLKRNFILKSFFFLWLMMFLLLSIEQIIGYPFFSGSILILATKGQSPFLSNLLTDGFFLGFLFAVLGIGGEYLLKKIKRI